MLHGQEETLWASRSQFPHHRSSKHHILSGFIRNHLTNLSDEAKTLIQERDALRTSNPTDPNIPSIDSQLADTIAADNRRRWRTELDSFSHRQDSGRLWRTMTTLSGKKPKTSPNQPITFSSHTHTNKRKIATAFCRQFSNTVVHTADRAARAFKRKVVRDHPLDHNIPGFSTNMVVQAIKACSNSIATGPNGLTMLHIKHLGSRSISYLTHLYTLSLRHADIPSIWKQATLFRFPRLANRATLDPPTSPSPSSALV